MSKRRLVITAVLAGQSQAQVRIQRGATPRATSRHPRARQGTDPRALPVRRRHRPPGPCPLCETAHRSRGLAVLISGHQVWNPCTRAAGLADVTRTLNAIAAVQDWTPTTERETQLLPAATLAADAVWRCAVQRLTPPRPVTPAEPEEPRPAASTVRAWAAANGIDCPVWASSRT